MFSENEPSENSERRLSEGPADEDRKAAEVEGLGGGVGGGGWGGHHTYCITS